MDTGSGNANSGKLNPKMNNTGYQSQPAQVVCLRMQGMSVLERERGQISDVHFPNILNTADCWHAQQ